MSWQMFIAPLGHAAVKIAFCCMVLHCDEIVCTATGRAAVLKYQAWSKPLRGVHMAPARRSTCSYEVDPAGPQCVGGDVCRTLAVQRRCL